MHETLHIRDDRALSGLVDRLGSAPEIALDTEFLRERTYYPKLCLLQVATRELMALVDPLAVRDLAPLWRVLTGDAEVVLHAASQDLEILMLLADDLPARWFDTQVAAAFLGYGDTLGYGRLVERVVGTAPRRSEAYTDWSRRPLTAEQEGYALDDVRYLLQCTDHLKAELAKRDRVTWVAEELDIQAEKFRNPTLPEQQWRRVSGSRSLSGRKLAILQAAAQWREETAQRRDIPRQRVVTDRVLVEVARRAPKSQAQLERLRGLHPREAERSAAGIIAAVQRAEALPESEWPRWPTPPARTEDPNLEALASFADAYLRTRARQLELSPRLIGTRQELVQLVRLVQAGDLESERAARLPLLRGWRYDEAGVELVGLLRGESSVRVGASGMLEREDLR